MPFLGHAAPPRARARLPRGGGNVAHIQKVQTMEFTTHLKRVSGASDRTVAAIADIFPGGRGLGRADETALTRAGATPTQAARIVAAWGLVGACERQSQYTARNPTQAERAIRREYEIATMETESFFVVCLDSRQAVIGMWETSRGGLASVDVHPREVFRTAIRASAHSIVVAHNHPSGDVAPSTADHELADRLRECGTLLGIPVVDSLILAGREGCYSMAANNWS